MSRLWVRVPRLPPRPGTPTGRAARLKPECLWVRLPRWALLIFELRFLIALNSRAGDSTTIKNRKSKIKNAQGGSRTHSRAGLSHAALPVGVPGRGGSRGTRTHKRLGAAAGFQDRSLIQPDGFQQGRVSGEWADHVPLRCNSPLTTHSSSNSGGTIRTSVSGFRAQRPTTRRLRSNSGSPTTDD